MDTVINIENQAKEALLVNAIGGSGDLTLDACDRPKVSANFSLFHGVFSHDASYQLWQETNDDVEVATGTSANVETTLECGVEI